MSDAIPNDRMKTMLLGNIINIVFIYIYFLNNI